MKRLIARDRQGLRIAWGGRTYRVAWPWLLGGAVMLWLIGRQVWGGATAEVLLSVMLGLVVAGFMWWQQRRLLLLEARLERLEKLLLQKRAVKKRDGTPLDSGERLLDEFFGGKQTRH